METKKREEIKCLFWNCTIKVDETKFGAYELIDDVRKADKHICLDCIDVIINNNLKPSQK